MTSIGVLIAAFGLLLMALAIAPEVRRMRPELPPALRYPAYRAYWLGLLVGGLGSIGLALYFKSRIGGYSGDCLGATQQISESLIYLTLLVSWTSI